MKQMPLHDQQPVEGSRRSIPDSKRVPLERKVILKFHHFGGFFIEYSANVSLTGMFIKTDSPKPPASVFIFEIWLGEDHKLVHGVGEVVWVRHDDEDPGRPAGMGIRFIKIDEESQAVVKRVIAEQVEKGGEVFDLAGDAPAGAIGDDGMVAGHPGLALVETGPEIVDRSDLLVLDEDLLGFERSAAAEPDDEVTMPVSVDRAGSGRGLRVALFLVVLGAVLGGAAYLFSADLLPF